MSSVLYSLIVAGDWFQMVGAEKLKERYHYILPYHYGTIMICCGIWREKNTATNLAHITINFLQHLDPDQICSICQQELQRTDTVRLPNKLAIVR